MKKELQKKLSFVLFVMAVFFAGVTLTVLEDSAVLVAVAGVLLLATAVFYVLQQEDKEQTPTGKTTEILLADRMAELMRGNEKAEKGVYIAVKKQHEAMEKGMEELLQKMGELVTAQENAVKTLVLYNKENTKQLALSEREELGRLRDELKQLQSGGRDTASMSSVVDAIREMSHRLYEELHETGEAMLSELETTADSLDVLKELMSALKESRPIVEASAPMAEAFDEKEELFAEEEEFFPEETFDDESVTEEPFVEETISPEEELPLFEEEAAPEEEPEVVPEPEEKKNPEDALASSGVDLSDPNKTLSPDDIAALIAALGN